MWVKGKPCFGDHIRVNRGFYYHHGIYASDDCVIHFASIDNTSNIDPMKAKIITTDLDLFLMGGILEVNVYGENELIEKRNPSEIINYALMRVGEGLGTYNLITNNCEHFANECVFGKKKSEQVENVFMKIFGGR